MNRILRRALLILLYLVGGILTYGYIEARRAPAATEQAVYFGMFWPAYWGCRGLGAAGDAAEWLFTPTAPAATVEKQF